VHIREIVSRVDDRELAELREILERRVDEIIESELGPKPTPQQLHGLAQELEEIADSHMDPARYLRADVAWVKAFDAAERTGGASLKEELSRAYGWDTPVAREARGAPPRAAQPKDVPVWSYRQELREMDFNEVLERLDLRRDDGFGYEL
jgi:hypothetical protein